MAVLFGVVRWIDHFVSAPFAEDFRVNYVAAEIGLTRGWSHLYDLDLQRQLSAGFGSLGSVINSAHNFVAPPLLAWLTVPLVPLLLPSAYLVWTLISLAALIVAWWLVSPGEGLARITLLLVALAIWPVHYAFWLGQTVIPVIALLALTWWLLEREMWAAAGAVLALTLLIKPQSALLLPAALLASGRWKPVAYCALVGLPLVLVSAASLGSSGIALYMQDVTYTGADPVHSVLTFGNVFGRGQLATGVETGLGLLALGLSWYRRDRLDLVFALGIVGTAASASYFHEYDCAVLVVAAWVVWRRMPSVPQRLWLLVGVAAAQFIAIGLALPMLLWEAIWIVLLGLEPWLSERARRRARAQPTTSYLLINGR
jgi:hypothetical protein